MYVLVGASYPNELVAQTWRLYNSETSAYIHQARGTIKYLSVRPSELVYVFLCLCVCLILCLWVN